MNISEPGGSQTNPYVGPVPFLEGQRLHGREKETDELADLLVSKRIVLLFAPSGAGKTSLIQAALVPRLRERYSLHPLPTVRLASVSAPKGANRYSFALMRALERDVPKVSQLSDDTLAMMSLAEFFERRFPTNRDPRKRRNQLLILDQFEELFTIDAFDWDAKRSFLTELGRVLAGGDDDVTETYTRAPTSIWALLSMREDRVAELQPFLDLIPTGLAYRYRLDPLERGEALEAVTSPAGDMMDVSAAEKLVDDLRTVQATAQDGTRLARLGRFVEPVQLQVVCRRLWERVVAGEGRAIRAEDVATSQGGSEVDSALRDYVDAEFEKAARAAGLREHLLRDWIESHLMTATGIRAQALREPVALGDLNEGIGRLIDAHVIKSDLRGEREWIELAHDRLVAPIRTGNQEWREHNLAPFQLQAKLWADTGKVHPDMLFTGKDLEAAELFASSHAEDLNDIDRQFLAASREARRRFENARKNRRIIFGVAATTLCALGALAAVMSQMANLSTRHREASAELEATTREQETRRRLFLKLARLRERAPADALRELLAVHDEIAARKPDNLSDFFDTTLRDILIRVPPSVERQLGRHTHIVRSLVATEGGERVISGSWDGTIAIWDSTRSGEPLHVTEKQGREIYSIALSESKGILASTFIDGSIALWRVSGNTLERVVMLSREQTGYQRQVTTAVFNREGTILATAGWDKSIRLWDVRNVEEPKPLASFGSRYHESPIHRIAFLPAEADAERLVSTDLRGKVRVWKIAVPLIPTTSEPAVERDMAVEDIQERAVGLYSAAVSPNGRYVAAGDSEGFVYLWDLAAKDPQKSGIRLTRAHHGRDDFSSQIYDMAFSPDGRELASVGVDGVVLRWSMPESSTPLEKLRKSVGVARIGGLGERLFSVVYHPRRPGAVIVGGTRTVRLLDLERRWRVVATPLATDIPRPSPWRSVSMDRASVTIAASRNDGRVRFWRREGDLVKPMPEWADDTMRSSMIALHPDGSRVASVECGGKVTMWSLSTGQPPTPSVISGRDAPAQDCPATAPLFSPDGSLFAVAVGPRLMVWTKSSGNKWERGFVGTLESRSESVGGGKSEQADPITAMAISRSSRHVAIGSRSGRIHLLDIENGKPAGAFGRKVAQDSDVVLALVFGLDGSRLFSGSEDGSISAWSVPSLANERRDERHDRSVTALSFADRGLGQAVSRPIMMSADREGLIREWTTGSVDGSTVAIAPDSGPPTRAMVVDASGSFMVTAGDDLLAWNFSRGAMVNAARRYLEAQGQLPGKAAE